MKNQNKIGTRLLIGGFLLAIIILLWLKGCAGDGKKTTTVIVPEVKGTFEAVKPVQNPLSKSDKSKIDNKTFGKNLSKKELEFWKAEAERLFKENQDLDQAFMNANDSLQQVIYQKSIELKAFNHTFDNDTLSATVKGIVRGEVQKLKLDYTIKERTIEVPKPKEKAFALLAGVEVGNTKSFTDFSAKANIGFQNKKGNIIHVGVDTEERFYVGYTVQVFSIKK